MNSKKVTVVCKICKVKISGTLNKRGELRASRSPDNAAPEIDGYCMQDAPHARLTGAWPGWHASAVTEHKPKKDD